MEKQLRILLLEDSEEDAGLIVRELNKQGVNFTLKIVDTEKGFVDSIINYEPDIILSDHSLPNINSLDALFIVKEYKLRVPFILVTGTVSEEFAVLCLKEGADNYILKNNLKRLSSAIYQAIKARNAEKEKEKSLEELIMANRVLNTFIYRVTHDLRGPLCSILGLVNLINNEKTKNNTSEYINMIGESTERLDKTLLLLIEIMSIRDSNLEINEIHFDKLWYDIFKKVENIENYGKVEFKITNRSKHILYSDERILTLVLQKIVENAIHYQKQDIKNSVVAITITDELSNVKIEITDNGVGIVPEVQDNIFSMFYRGLSNSKGSGLGLYVAKIGIEKIGGSIKVKSEENLGSRFTLLIPVKAKEM